jgi:hypothetical protein
MGHYQRHEMGGRKSPQTASQARRFGKLIEFIRTTILGVNEYWYRMPTVQCHYGRRGAQDQQA